MPSSVLTWIVRFLIASAEVAAGIAALILRGNLKEVIRDRMRDGMENYGKEFCRGIQYIMWNHNFFYVYSFVVDWTVVIDV